MTEDEANLLHSAAYPDRTDSPRVLSRPFEPLLVVAGVVCVAAQATAAFTLRSVADWQAVDAAGWFERIDVAYWLYALSSGLALAAILKVWWQGGRRQAGILALFVLALGFFGLWMLTVHVGGPLQVATWISGLTYAATVGVTLSFLAAVLGHGLYAFFTRRIRRLRPRLCTAGLVVVWMVGAGLPLARAYAQMEERYDSFVTRFDSEVPSSTTGEWRGTDKTHIEQDIIKADADGVLRVRDEYDHWFGSIAGQEPRVDEPLASWAGKFADRVSERNRMQLVVAPAAEIEEFARILGEVRTTLPRLEAVALNTVAPTRSPRISRILSGWLDLPLTAIPVRLSTPDDALECVLVSDASEQYRIGGEFVAGPDGLGQALETRAPAHVVVHASPDHTVQDLVDVLDVIRTATAAEVSIR